MNHFPVITSVLSPQQMGQFVASQYGLKGMVVCRLLKAGISHTYLIESPEDRFVFRVYCLHWRTKTEIEEELRLLCMLKENKIAVSYPIADENNGYIQLLNAPEGDRYGVLFSYAPGDKIQFVPEEIHFRIGRLMATIHQKTYQVQLQRITYTPEVLLHCPLKHLSLFLSDDTDEMRFMKRISALITTEWEKIAWQEVRTGVAHLDLWFDNLNVDAGGNITVFDFDFCGNGPLCLDLAYYRMQLYNIERDQEKCDSKLSAFMSGYESVIRIPEEEKRILPLLGIAVYTFYLGTQCARFNDWSGAFLSEPYLKRFISQIIERYAGLHDL